MITPGALLKVNVSVPGSNSVVPVVWFVISTTGNVQQKYLRGNTISVVVITHKGTVENRFVYASEIVLGVI